MDMSYILHKHNAFFLNLTCDIGLISMRGLPCGRTGHGWLSLHPVFTYIGSVIMG